MWVEWWGFEGLALLVGTLPQAEVQLGANGVIFNSVVTLYQIFSGLGDLAHCGAAGGRAHPLASVHFVGRPWCWRHICGDSGCRLVGLRSPLAHLFTSPETVNMQRTKHGWCQRQRLATAFMTYTARAGALRAKVPHSPPRWDIALSVSSGVLPWQGAVAARPAGHLAGQR